MDGETAMSNSDYTGPTIKVLTDDTTMDRMADPLVHNGVERVESLITSAFKHVINRYTPPTHGADTLSRVLSNDKSIGI